MNIIKKDETFKNNPLPVFVKDLRNYTLHYALPATFAQMEVSQDAQTKKQIITTQAFLNKKSLLHGYDYWKPESKKYLSEPGDEIDLLDLINKHHNIFTIFYDWLIYRL